MKIEKFTVEIERENGQFVGVITYDDEKIDVTQANSMPELYTRIAEVLSLRLEDAECVVRETEDKNE